MRLQVFLAKSGICSRRDALEFIKQGFVKVNSRVILEPSTSVNSDVDKIEFKGREAKLKKFVYILLNKPKGVITTKEDKFADKLVIDLLPKDFRHLNPVGRLDKDTTGLLLLTNDGELIFRLTHPKFGIKKTYFVKIKGQFGDSKKNLLEKGILLYGAKTQPALIKVISLRHNFTELVIEINEGKKRQVRLMFDSVGCPVIELKRIKEGPLELGSLEIGKWRNLSQKEIEDLYKETGLHTGRQA